MSLQSGKAISVRYKAQAGLGQPASGTGGFELPVAPSPGFNLQKVSIEDPTIRSDGLSLIGRHGSQSVTGSYEVPLRLAALNNIFEAVLRTTAVAGATLTGVSITTTTSTIVRGTGDWLAAGVRAGMVIRLASSAQAANNGRNLLVTAVSATTISVADTLVADATPATANVALPRMFATDGTPINRYWTLEQVYQDIGESLLAADAKFTGMSFALQPDNTAIVTVSVVGRSADAEVGSASPVLTSPTQYSGRALIATDAKLWRNGGYVTDVTDLSFDYDLAGATVPVVGSVLSPDVFTNQATLSGTFSALRRDLGDFLAFQDEDEFGISVTLVEPEAAPEDFVSLYIPLAKFTSNDAQLGEDNAMVESRGFTAGAALGITGVPPTMLAVYTSAA